MLFHPAFPLLVVAFIALAVPATCRKVISLLAPIISAIFLFLLDPETVYHMSFLKDYHLLLIRLDDISFLMTLVICLITFLFFLYTWHQTYNMQGVAALVYAASAIGSLLSGDWITLIFCWELMAVAAVALIWLSNRYAFKAGFRYLLIHFFGGNLLLGGIVLLIGQNQYVIGQLLPSQGAAYWLVLAGLGLSAGFLPFHSWIPDAYSRVGLGASVLMNCLTTKVAVMTLIRVFPGDQNLLIMGIVMAFWGVLYALRENDFRRLLCYHIISQMGIIIAGIGIGTPLALNGAVALTIGNMIYKGLLFMTAGAVVYATDKTKLTELSGLAKQLPGVAFIFFIAALAIAGMPGFAGFATKPMILSAASAAHMDWAELLLIFAGLGTFLSIPLKMGYFLFLAPPKEGQENPIKRKIPIHMYWAMGILTVVCVVIGLFPQILYQMLPYTIPYTSYHIGHILQECQLLAAAALTFYLMRPIAKPHAGITLDFDWFYRVPLRNFFLGLSKGIDKIRGLFWDDIIRMVKKASVWNRNPYRTFAGNTENQPVSFDPDHYRAPMLNNVLYPILVLMVILILIYVTI